MDTNSSITTTFSRNGYTAAEDVLLLVLLFVIILWTILGNLTVIIAVGCTNSLRKSPSNMLIANLALSDLLLGLLVLPFSAVGHVFAYWPFAKEICYMWLVVGKKRYI